MSAQNSDDDDFEVMADETITENTGDEAKSTRSKKSLGAISTSSTQSRDGRLRRQNDEDRPLLTFKIPLRKEQLCDDPRDDKIFYVQDRVNMSNIDEQEIISELENVGGQLCGQGSKCLEITNNLNFDPLYSILFHLENMTPNVQKQLITLLQIGFKQLRNYIQHRGVDHTAKEIFISPSMIRELESGSGNPKVYLILTIQNAIKAYVYLICWFLSDFCKLKRESKLSKRGRKKNAGDQTEKLYQKI